jgi:hypothetical protein
VVYESSELLTNTAKYKIWLLKDEKIKNKIQRFGSVQT